MADARDHILTLTKAQQDRAEWQAAARPLLRAGNGELAWAFIARIAVHRAICGTPKQSLDNPNRKPRLGKAEIEERSMKVDIGSFSSGEVRSIHNWVKRNKRDLRERKRLRPVK